MIGGKILKKCYLTNNDEAENEFIVFASKHNTISFDLKSEIKMKSYLQCKANVNTPCNSS